jgi:hypothetical protein
MLSVGSRILGVIVNDVPRRKDGYGYGYYSYGSYRYGNTGKRSAAAAATTARATETINSVDQCSRCA